MDVMGIINSGGDYLKATDFKNQDGSFNAQQLTINEVSSQEFDQDNGSKKNKLLLHFNELDGVLVLNVTNTLAIAQIYGNESDNWINRQIVVTAGPKQFGNRIVDGIIVSPPLAAVPGQTAPPQAVQAAPAPQGQQYAHEQQATAQNLAQQPDDNSDIPF